MIYSVVVFFFFQAEDGIRDAQESRGLGDVYKRQRRLHPIRTDNQQPGPLRRQQPLVRRRRVEVRVKVCLLYTSDAADDLLCVDLGGRRIIQKKNTQTITSSIRDHKANKYRLTSR